MYVSIIKQEYEYNKLKNRVVYVAVSPTELGKSYCYEIAEIWNVSHMVQYIPHSAWHARVAWSVYKVDANATYS